MKIRRFAHFGLLWALLSLTTLPSQAQNMVNELDEKFHLEKSISERLEQTLKTRLEKNYFDITVEAKLHHKSTTGRKFIESLKTDDLRNWYSNELTQVSHQNARPFELESLVVTLGLSDQVDPSYRDNLKAWLQTWVQSSFGAKGEAQVIIRPTNIISKVTKSLDGEDAPSKWNGIGRFQNLLGMIFLGCAFMLGRFLQNRSRPKVITASSFPANTTLTEEQAEEALQKETIRTLKTKIAWISPGIKRQVDTLIASWSDKDTQSYLKIAAYLEALAEGGASMPEASRAQAPVLPPHAHLSLPKALTNLQELETSMQLSLYQEIYSELLAGELIEREPRHIDFEFLNDWTEKDLQEAFDYLSEPCQVALLTRLPQSMRRRYSQIADPSRLRRILTYSLKQSEVSDEDLLKELHHWQKRREHSLSAPEFAFKIAKLREAWSVFSRVEETLWLHQVGLTHPEMKEALTRESTHLAFLGDWSPDMIRKFCLTIKSRELAAAAKLLPFLTQPILSVCGETTRKEIQQEMATLTEPKLTHSFDKFVAAFDHFVEVEQSHEQSASRTSPRGAA